MKTYWIPTGDWFIGTGYEYAHRLMKSFGLAKGTENNYDVLVLAGGADIGDNIKRDEFEFTALKTAHKEKKQVFGICRGMQVMLYASGATLIKHIPDEPNVLEHRTLTSEWKGQSGWHRTKVGLLVNSRHHQGARGNIENWQIIDEAEDGIIEAVQAKGQYGVQWHPEHPEMLNTPALEWLKRELKKYGII